MEQILNKILEIIADGTTNIIITKDFNSGMPEVILDDRFKWAKSKMVISDNVLLNLSDFYGDPDYLLSETLNALWESHKKKKSSMDDILNSGKHIVEKYEHQGEEDENEYRSLLK